MRLTGEESNYYVLKRVLGQLKRGTSRDKIIAELQEFINGKKVIENELTKLSRKATSGDDESARELISMLAEMNDGI